MSLKRITTKDGEVYFVDAKTGQRVEVDQHYTTTKPNPTNLRFNNLLSLGQFVSFFGWIIVIASIIGILWGIVEIKNLGAVVIIGGVISLVNGILVAAIGQITSCFVSIERNTFETNNLLKSFQPIQNEEIQ